MSEGDVPKLPRGRGLRLSRPQLVRIGLLAILLAFLLLTQRPCADAVSGFVTGFGDRGSAAPALPRPGTMDGSGASGSGSAAPGDDIEAYERLRPGMTEDEIKAVIERARTKAGSAAVGKPSR